MRARACPWIAAALPALLAVPSGHAQDSVEMRVDVRAEAGRESGTPPSPWQIHVELRDRITGQPLGGRPLLAWIHPRETAGDPQACRSLARKLVNVGTPMTGLDLNGYLVGLVGEDDSVTVLDPGRSLASANLLRVERLGTRPRHWQVDDASGRLWLTLPERRQLAGVPLEAGGDVETIDLPGEPLDLAMLAGDAPVLVLLQDGAVHAFDRAGRGRALLPDSTARRLVAIPGEARAWLVGNAQVALVDAETGTTGDAIAAPAGIEPGSAIYSPAADALLAAGHGDDALWQFRRDDPAGARRIALPWRARTLLPLRDGRYVAVVSADGRRLLVVDTSSGRPTGDARGTFEIESAAPIGTPVATRDFLYLRIDGSAEALQLAIEPILQTGVPSLLRIAFGSSAHALVPGSTDGAWTPQPVRGLIAANPRDRYLFHFEESGMAVPTRATRLATASPRGLVTHVRRLRENAGRGGYTGHFTPPRAGDYELVLATRDPAAASCTPFAVHAADPADTDADRHALRTLRLTRVEGARDAGVGQTLNWQMHFSAESGAGRWPDIPVLLASPGRNWQKTVEITADADGVAALSMQFDAPGHYVLVLPDEVGGWRLRDARKRMEITIH